MLDQHSKIFCGPETNLFTQSNWMVDWDKTKRDMHSKFLNSCISTGWHIHRGVQITHLISNFESCTKNEQILDYKTFIHILYHNVINNNAIEIIGEKTPSNAPNFHLIEQIFTRSSFILTVRNPMDSIISMRRRGWSLIYACGLYLFNISLGYSKDQNLEVVKYEDLVREKESVLGAILKSIDLNFETSMIVNLDRMKTLPTWNISGAEYNTKYEDDKLMIYYLLDHLCFKEGFSFYGKLPYFKNIREIMNEFGYFKVKEEIGFGEILKCKYLLQLEKLKRKFKHYPLSGDQFPFEIR